MWELAERLKDFNFEMFKSLGGRGFNSSCWGEHSDNGN